MRLSIQPEVQMIFIVKIQVADRRGADAERVGPRFIGGEECRDIKLIVLGIGGGGFTG